MNAGSAVAIFWDNVLIQHHRIASIEHRIDNAGDFHARGMFSSTIDSNICEVGLFTQGKPANLPIRLNDRYFDLGKTYNLFLFHPPHTIVFILIQMSTRSVNFRNIDVALSA